ncbi:MULTISPECIES: hypothetical protein [Paenibacillus]|uniref:hypothetical protein n=1 Tax=Paenibacillus TaxID=44249 RepID=UPI00097A9032|nr:hypothetical protein [Paenibacillus peoriae]OMF79861.1 hypothetical protein BK145_12980 [Paenibacillus peoriae]
MSERIINLPDGLQPMSEEDLKTIWNKADDARGEEAHMSNDVFDLVNALDAAYAQIDSLQQQLAERDRAIARQSAALETATDALNSIINGEWSETIDDQFLEVWTTRRINPSQIADEALLAIGQELDALGE